MSKRTFRLLAIAALALSAAFLGHHQASAFSLGSSFILSQAGGGAGGGGAGGAPGSGGTPGTPGSTPGALGSTGTPGTGSDAAPGLPDSRSPSAGVPAQCASITNASERAACIKRLDRSGTAPKQ